MQSNYQGGNQGNYGSGSNQQFSFQGQQNSSAGFPSEGMLKSPMLSQDTSDGSNSQLQAKKLNFKAGIFVPKTTAQGPEQQSYSSGAGGGLYGLPNVQSSMSQNIPVGLNYPNASNNTSGYSQAGGTSYLQMGKYTQGGFAQSNPIAQSPSPSMGYNPGPNSYMGLGQGSGTGQSGGVENEKEYEKVVENIAALKFSDKREDALQELSKKRESIQNLARLLWYSVGTVAVLLQEIVNAYPFLSPPNLSQTMSNRACNVLGLLQCLALHSETRTHFLNAHIPLYLYPFLNTTSKSKPFENLRVTSLGVIGALVKGDDSDATNFLVQTEIIPLCLRIMKRGLELSRTVATFIVQKILLDNEGLQYICQTADRFFAIVSVLNQMVEDLVANNKDDQRLLRHIIRCYHRLSDNSKANEALRKSLPASLKKPEQTLITDEAVRKWHMQLLQNLGFL